MALDTILASAVLGSVGLLGWWAASRLLIGCPASEICLTPPATSGGRPQPHQLQLGFALLSQRQGGHTRLEVEPQMRRSLRLGPVRMDGVHEGRAQRRGGRGLSCVEVRPVERYRPHRVGDFPSSTCSPDTFGRVLDFRIRTTSLSEGANGNHRRCRGAEAHMCRGAETREEAQRCRGAETQRGIGVEENE